MLEKLLRSCPDIGQIYLLLRPKRHKQAVDRIKGEILETMCFQRCQRERKDFLEYALDKITFILGDLT